MYSTRITKLALLDQPQVYTSMQYKCMYVNLSAISSVSRVYVVPLLPAPVYILLFVALRHSDEFTLPYAFVAVGRTVWVLFIVVSLVITGGYMISGSCRTAGYLALCYEIVSIIVGAISVVVELRIAVASTYGTIIGEYITTL